MKNKYLLLPLSMLLSGQALAWGDFLGNALQNAAQQAVGGAVQQAVAPNAPQPVPAGVAYGANGCVQNVPAGPPGMVADVDRDGCVTHLEYSNHVTYLAKHAPQYLGGENAGVQPAAVSQGQAAGAAAQGLMGLFGR